MPQTVSAPNIQSQSQTPKEESDFERCVRRSGRLWNRGDQWRATLDEIHELSPVRRHASRSGNTIANDRQFDGTLSNAQMRFAGRLQTDLTPTDEQFAILEPGPLMPAGDERKQLATDLDGITKLVDATLSNDVFQTASVEVYADLFAGQGAMISNPGEDYDDIVNDVAVPSYEIVPEEDGYGRVKGVVWRRMHYADNLPGTFPKAKFSDQLMQQIKAEQDREIEVTQYTYRDEKGRWQHRAMIKGESAYAAQSNSRVSPWLTPRFFKLPGIAQGFGVAHLALPHAKTVNKARELALKAAAFALLGLWMQRDDGVFDPDTARFHPGAFLKVGSTGGPMGPTLSRMELPGNFDISSITIDDEREQIKIATFDDRLPPMTGAVRTPTEIVERMRRLDADWAGVDGRLSREIIRPLYARRLEILEQRNILPTKLTIDQLLVKCSIVSPMARARRTRKAQTIVEGLTLTASLVGKELMMMIADVEEAVIEILRELGVPERLIRSKEARAQLQQMIGQIIAQQQMAANPAAAPPEAA